VGVALGGSAVFVAGTAHADSLLTAHYQARLAILPINFASATLKAKVLDRGRYTVDLEATGLGFGIDGHTPGTVVRNTLVPRTVSIDTRDSGDRKQSIRMTLLGGRVQSESVVPPMPPFADRVPLSREDRRNVLDPLTAMVIPLPPGMEPSNPSVCNRTLPLFEGTERFNIRMSFLRSEKVKTAKGYEGPVVVCRATYKAIAGHRKRKQVSYMEENRTIEAWLAPVGDSRFLVPWRISLGTMLGPLIVEANDFQTSDLGTAELRGTSKKGTAR
jgi:hypothetical protein